MSDTYSNCSLSFKLGADQISEEVRELLGQRWMEFMCVIALCRKGQKISISTHVSCFPHCLWELEQKNTRAYHNLSREWMSIVTFPTAEKSQILVGVSGISLPVGNGYYFVVHFYYVENAYWITFYWRIEHCTYCVCKEVWLLDSIWVLLSNKLRCLLSCHVFLRPWTL